jgi:hypothetical protein
MVRGLSWLAMAVVIAFVLGTGAASAAAGNARTPALQETAHLAADDDDDGDDDDDDDGGRRATSRSRGDQRTAGDRGDTGTSGGKTRDEPKSGDDKARPREDGTPAPVGTPAPKGADSRTLSAGTHVGPLVLLAIVGTGVLVGTAFWLARKFGPTG